MDVSFTPLTSDMTRDVYAAVHGNVATSFTNFIDESSVNKWVESALIEIEAGKKIEIAVYNDKQFVGLCSLRDLKTPFPEFGLWVHPEHQGKGVGKASVLWLIDWAKKNLPQAEALIYDADPENIASNKLAISAGLMFEKECSADGQVYKRYMVRV